MVSYSDAIRFPLDRSVPGVAQDPVRFPSILRTDGQLAITSLDRSCRPPTDRCPSAEGSSEPWRGTRRRGRTEQHMASSRKRLQVGRSCSNAGGKDQGSLSAFDCGERAFQPSLNRIIHPGVEISVSGFSGRAMFVISRKMQRWRNRPCFIPLASSMHGKCFESHRQLLSVFHLIASFSSNGWPIRKFVYSLMRTHPSHLVRLPNHSLITSSPATTCERP